MREPVKREEVSRLSPQAASLEFARVLRVWLDSTRGPCIMWNRASSARRRIVGFGPRGCPHRMACAKCSFYLPKESTKAQLFEAKANLLRLRQDIPLADAELAAVEEGVGAYERLLATLADVPTPGGSTPRQLTAERLVQLE